MKRTHGQSGTSLYRVWSEMKQRCSNPKNPAWKNYGARGIKVCPRWRKSFEAFIEDMGPRPPGLTLDRLDNDGGYTPSNCAWRTRSENNANRRPWPPEYGQRIKEWWVKRRLSHPPQWRRSAPP